MRWIMVLKENEEEKLLTLIINELNDYIFNVYLTKSNFFLLSRESHFHLWKVENKVSMLYFLF